MEAITITPRERIVWAMLVNGLIKKEMATELHRSEHTVNELLRRLYTKIGAHNAADAVREFFLYYGYCTRRELAEAAAMPKAIVVAALLSLTGLQMFAGTDDVRSNRTSRTNAPSMARTNAGRKNYIYA